MHPCLILSSSIFIILKMVSSARMNEYRIFDETKAGVKGLVDAGITKVPPMFIHFPDGLGCSSDGNCKLSVPTIDLIGVGTDPVQHKKVVDEIRDASESWGFFRIINHGIPANLVQDVIDGTRKFHEQDVEAKTRFYTRDNRKKGLSYCSNYHMYTLPVAEWRDMIMCSMAPDAPDEDDLPLVCGGILMEYSKWVMELGHTLFKLLSEGLGLEPNRLLDMRCGEGLLILGHYYPPCPEPELTLGIRKHSDANFMTVVAQDNLGGLQVLHRNQWVDVEPIPGALVVNVGNLLQIVSNDRCKSVEHRVVAKRAGPRVSVASFFSTGRNTPSSLKAFRPIKELVSEESPAKYPAITVMEYEEFFKANRADGCSTLMQLKL